MKKIVFLLILAALIGGAFYLYRNPALVSQNSLLTFSYCEQPISYRIDTIDPRFKLTYNQFKDRVDQAVKLWNSEYPTPLFVEDPNAELTVNLVYDDRQTLSNQINELEGDLGDSKKPLQTQIDEYNIKSAQFRQQIEALNNEIESWNARGGAPPEVYNQLLARQQQLQQQGAELTQLGNQLNQSTDAYNNQVAQLNQTINTFNDALAIKPEEGVYDHASNRIEIYFNIDRNEMVHTIAHEFGHALGIDHNPNKLSLMYPYTSKTLKLTSDDLASLKEVCRERSYLEPLKIYLQTLQNRFSAS